MATSCHAHNRLNVPAIVLLLSLPLVYLLGSGPAVWMVTYEWISFDTYSKVYAPLVLVEEKSPAVHSVFRSYRELFIPMGIWLSDYPQMRCGS